MCSSDLSVAEIKDSGKDHQFESEFQPAVQRSDYPQNSAKEIHRGNRVGNMFYDNVVHLLYSKFLLQILREGILVDENIHRLRADE